MQYKVQTLNQSWYSRELLNDNEMFFVQNRHTLSINYRNVKFVLNLLQSQYKFRNAVTTKPNHQPGCSFAETILIADGL